MAYFSVSLLSGTDLLLSKDAFKESEMVIEDLFGYK